MQKTHVFDFLNEWMLYSDEEINKIISEETIATLQCASNLLTDELSDSAVIVTQNNFIHNVRKMSRICKEGSRALGYAIIEASEWINADQPDKAKEIYEQFLVSCNVPFYRKIALNRLKEIS